MDITLHPLADAKLSDLKDYPWPKGDDPGRFVGLRDRAVALRKDTPYAVVSGISGVVFEFCCYLRSLEQWFCDLMTTPEFCEAMLDQTLQFWLDWFRVFLDEVGDVVDVIMIGDDLAGQNGPLFNPDLYRRIVKPRHKRLVQYIRSRTRAKIWYHTCGSCLFGPRPFDLDFGAILSGGWAHLDCRPRMQRRRSAAGSAGPSATRQKGAGQQPIPMQRTWRGAVAGLRPSCAPEGPGSPESPKEDCDAESVENVC